MKKDFNRFFKKSFSMTMILMLLIMSMPIISIAADSTFGVTALNVTETTAELAFDNQTLGSTVDVSLSPDVGLYDGSSLFSDLTPGTHYTVSSTESIKGSIEKTYNVYLNTTDFTLYYTDDNGSNVLIDFTDCYYYLDGTRYPRLSLLGVSLGSPTFIDVMVPTLVTNVASTTFDTIAIPVLDDTSLTLDTMPIELENKDTQTKWRIINNFGEDTDFTWRVYGTEITGNGTVAKEHTMDERFDNPYFLYVDTPHPATLVIIWGSTDQFTTQTASVDDISYPEMSASNLVLTSMPIESTKADTQTKWRVFNKFGEPITFSYTVTGHPEATGTYTIGAEYTEANRFDNPFYFYIDLPHAVTATIHWGDSTEFTNTKASSGEVITEVVTTETPETTAFTTQPEPEQTVPTVVQGSQGTVNVNYIDTGGTSVATSFSFTGAIGSQYLTSTKTVFGYTLIAIPTNASGSFVTDPLTVNYVYSNDEVITDESTPLGEAGTPVDFDAIYEGTDVTPIDFDANLTMEPTNDEAIITDEETPLADALPQTGQASSELFFGIGGIISALGILLKIKIK
jgi:hypothetical protein